MDIKIIIVLVVAVVIALAIISIVTGGLSRVGISQQAQAAIAQCQSCISAASVGYCVGTTATKYTATECATICKQAGITVSQKDCPT